MKHKYRRFDRSGWKKGRMHSKLRLKNLVPDKEEKEKTGLFIREKAHNLELIQRMRTIKKEKKKEISQ